MLYRLIIYVWCIMDSYFTIEKEAYAEITEKKSRFIGYIRQVSTEEDAITFINEIKAKNHSARHNVFAYKLLNGIKRYSDDGEPQGTAGIPILEIIENERIENICVVITRYFGGILLGTGGLLRAYSLTAKKSIDAAQVIEMKNCAILEIRCNYTQYGKLPSVISLYDGIIDDTSFLDDISVKIHLPIEKVSDFAKEIQEIYAGTLQFNKIGEDFFKK